MYEVSHGSIGFIFIFMFSLIDTFTPERNCCGKCRSYISEDFWTVFQSRCTVLHSHLQYYSRLLISPGIWQRLLVDLLFLAMVADENWHLTVALRVETD